MAYGVKLHVWGEYACFTRPEMKVERVSYDVLTPSAARGILEAIHWKPAIRWVVDRIHVLKPIRFDTVRRNEIGRKIAPRQVRAAMSSGASERLAVVIEDDRQQRTTTLLRDVAYVIEAHFKLTVAAPDDDTAAKHQAMFNRRATKGQCFQRPYLGTREFAAHFAPVSGALPRSELPADQRDLDLGWMLHDIDFAGEPSPRFFRAVLRGGSLEVPPPHSAEVRG